MCAAFCADDSSFVCEYGVGRRRKNVKKKRDGQSSPGPSTGRSRPAGGEGAGRRQRFRSWVRSNRSDLRFLLIFGVCLSVYYAATLTSPIKNGFFPTYLRWNASVSGALLQVLGQDVVVVDQSIGLVGGASIQVERGCDAVAPSALFVSAVLASPVALGSRLAAAALGSVALMLLNLLRVISLFLVRVYYPKAFDTVHLDVWQALFILLALLLWALWASRASKKARLSHASA